MTGFRWQPLSNSFEVYRRVNRGGSYWPSSINSPPPCGGIWCCCCLLSSFTVAKVLLFQYRKWPPHTIGAIVKRGMAHTQSLSMAVHGYTTRTCFLYVRVAKVLLYIFKFNTTIVGVSSTYRGQNIRRRWELILVIRPSVALECLGFLHLPFPTSPPNFYFLLTVLFTLLTVKYICIWLKAQEQ